MYMFPKVLQMCASDDWALVMEYKHVVCYYVDYVSVAMSSNFPWADSSYISLNV